jgi:hypothetical protein
VGAKEIKTIVENQISKIWCSQMYHTLHKPMHFVLVALNLPWKLIRTWISQMILELLFK